MLKLRLDRIAACWLVVMLLPECTPLESATGSLEVTVVSTADATMGGVDVTISGAPSQTTTDASGVALFPQVATGMHTVRVADCPGTRNVSVVANEVARVRVWVCADVVELPYAPNEQMIAMLDIKTDDGTGSTKCEQDALRLGVGAVNILDNAVPLGTCHGGVAVFTPNHALAYSTDASTMLWTGGVGDVHSVESPGKPLRIPIAFILSVGQSQATIDAVTEYIKDIQLVRARTLLRKSFTGLELFGDESGGSIAFTVASAQQAQAIGNGCSAVAAIKANAQIYQPGRLNVYVLPKLDAAKAGETCVAEFAQNVIFFNAGGAMPFTLVHEIGHALGLLRPNWGHTIGLKGFYEVTPELPLNVMQGTKQLDSRYFSISQAARMTLSKESWINQASAANGTTLRQRQSPGAVLPLSFKCGCPETNALQNCPALATDIVRAFTLQVDSPDVLSCGVTVSAPATMSCSAPVDVNATFTPSGALGGDRWVSLDPSIVTVVQSTTIDRQATLTAHANGTGRLRAWADGSFRNFSITVAGCP